jgi:predicted O-methyltransferase YrrM
MTDELFSRKLVDYLDALVPPRAKELAGMEAYGKRTGFPIIGPASGHFCYLVARLIGARQVFEMGSGYGYSTAWFARAVRENGGGRVVHSVWDEELSQQARRHLADLGFADLIDYRVGEAVGLLRADPGPYDLIFLDIDKDGYPAALDEIERKLRPAGVLIADNLLLSGSVMDRRQRSPRVEGVRTLTRRVMSSAGWTASIVPIRDGLLLAYRR